LRFMVSHRFRIASFVSFCDISMEVGMTIVCGGRLSCLCRFNDGRKRDRKTGKVLVIYL
jgi:hypothetical protein